MNFQNLLQHRYSVRAYKADPIDPDLLNQLLYAAQYAPTAANKQPFKLIVIHTQGKEKEIQKIYNREWFSDAPIVICACGIPGEAWSRADGKPYLDVDIAIVMDHLSLAAADLGLGTCWVASFDAEAARRYLEIPDLAEPIILMSLGYPADLPKEKERKSIEALVAYDSWNNG